MREHFNIEELDIAKEIINIGLAKAADSMAFFTKEKVFIRSLDVQLMEIEAIGKVSQKNDDEAVSILTTELKGELGGVCYLVFSENEVDEILRVSLPPSILEDKEKLRVMSEAILLEMDNIIVASVVTQFSNFFDFKMYGDIPRMLKSKVGDLKKVIESANKSSKYILYFKSEFNTTGMDINPEFVWLLDDKFISGVKSITKTGLLMKSKK